MRAIAIATSMASSLLLASVGAAADAVAPQHSCATIEWNPQFLSAYPTAAAACRQVVLKHGIEYAELQGIVSQVDHDVIQVKISDVMGMPLTKIAFLTGKRGRVIIDETGSTVDSLKPGDALTFWIREGRFGVSPTLKDRPMLIVRPENVEQLIENLGLPDHFIDLR